ncbi:MAG TPA: N-acetyl-gamma-glutamyl-phosphate reductase [Caldithrix abyssi]|uniref:N-acetyl-gamma-glutamyl-phosphate reductase n=1 Tax=Caldithrix abyssi TaxID=187145 RepID=A0A7V1PVK7_CALAY|nr:N-acetyl-gamma-glutamyl-phosphate reductase [Caldithrix abyssi]
MAYPQVERQKSFKVGIVGAGGYTGSELARLLALHPDVELRFATSEKHQGKKLSDLHPHALDRVDLTLISAEEACGEKTDLVFLALPHGVSQNYAARFLDMGCRVIDLSGDFRLPDGALYEQWYGKAHQQEALLKEAVFGLPELFRNEIRNARLVANPGCYPTSAILGLAPLLKAELIDPRDIIIDSKSGVTGAGITPGDTTHFPRVTDNFSAYGLMRHRHTPEIEIALRQLYGHTPRVQFTPHLLPVDRGILTTIYARPLRAVSNEEVRELFARFYFSEHFVRMSVKPPEIKQVRGSNYCDLYPVYDERTNRIMVISVIDNLVKGAAGQAIQNMNIIFRLIENSGLRQLPIYP